MTSILSQPMRVVVGETGMVAADLPCRKCAYNLRGLNVDGRCPECGTPVGFSAQGDFLRFSDPDWLLKLARGVRLIVWAVLVGIVGTVIFAFALGGSREGRMWTTLLMVGVYIMMLVGTWFLTEPDPSGLGEDRYGTSRKLIRITLAIGILNQAIDLLTNTTTLSPDLRTVVALLSGLFGIASVVGLFAQLQYLKKLALRIPAQRLADRAGFLMYALGTSFGILIVGGVLVAILMTGGGGRGAIGGVGCFFGIVGLAVIVFFIMYLLLLEKLGKAFAAEARVAQHTWARAAADITERQQLSQAGPPPPSI
jgi:hypothetical protein